MYSYGKFRETIASFSFISKKVEKDNFEWGTEGYNLKGHFKLYPSVPHSKMDVQWIHWWQVCLSLVVVCIAVAPHRVMRMAVSTEGRSSLHRVLKSERTLFLPYSSCCQRQKLSSIFSPWCPIYMSVYTDEGRGAERETKINIFSLI